MRCQCREGLYALPKTMFDLFFSGCDIFQRLGHFLWKGMKPFPALGTMPPEYPCKYLIINENIWYQ